MAEGYGDTVQDGIVGGLFGNLSGYVFVYLISLFPSMFLGVPPPDIAELTQTNMSIKMLLGSLLSVNGMVQQWYSLVGQRNRVIDLYDALVECQIKSTANGDTTKAELVLAAPASAKAQVDKEASLLMV